jgi:hypothetical protein
MSRFTLCALLVVTAMSLTACGDASSASNDDDSGISTSGADGGISELDGSVTTDAATAGPSDASDANADEDGCWWCTDADANSAPETLAGDDSGKGGGGGGKDGGGGGKDGVGLTLEECIEQCIEKGESLEVCEPTCEEYVGAGGGGMASDTCYEDCIDKGASPDECLEACGDDDESDDGDEGNEGNEGDDEYEACYESCMDAGKGADACEEYCSG